MFKSTLNYITALSLLHTHNRILIAQYMATNDVEVAEVTMREIKSNAARIAELKTEQRANICSKFVKMFKGH